MLHKVLENIVNRTMRSLEERLSLLDGSNYPQLWRTKAPSSGKATISDTTRVKDARMEMWRIAVLE